MPTYLQKRAHRWYAVLEIPKPLRKRFGKPRFIKSLETESRVVAERRVLPVVGAWKKEIASAKGEPVDDDTAFWRRRLRLAKDEESRNSILEQIEDAAWEIGAVNVDQVGQAPSTDPEARQFYAEATGQVVKFTEHLDEWLSSFQGTPKTKDLHRSAVNRFASEFKTVGEVTRPEVRRWVTREINEGGRAPKTMERILSGLRGYWAYLQSINVVDEDAEPFRKLDTARAVKRNAHRSNRQPFEPNEVVTLLEASEAQGDMVLADLIRLGMWTGCRIEELCSLKIEDVKDDHFSIKDAKTKAGWRDVPVHSKLKPTVERLLDSGEDDYLLSGLTENKYGDRSNAVGKRFGRLKKVKGFGPEYVFHSIRKTVVTILENAGIPENVVADIVGHEKTTMTYGLYSGGVNLAVKRRALETLIYPSA